MSIYWGLLIYSWTQTVLKEILFYINLFDVLKLCCMMMIKCYQILDLAVPFFAIHLYSKRVLGCERDHPIRQHIVL